MNKSTLIHINIRHSTESDINAIFELYQQKSNYSNTLQHPFPSFDYWQKRLSQLPENQYSLVAVVDDKIVGQLGMEVITRPRRKHVANLGMAVCESSRGLGIGKVLLSSALDLAHNWLAVRKVEIEVYTDNLAAIALYESCGFNIEGTSKDYAFRNGEYIDAHYMASIRK